jgi:hypothetical protein
MPESPKSTLLIVSKFEIGRQGTPQKATLYVGVKLGGGPVAFIFSNRDPLTNEGKAIKIGDIVDFIAGQMDFKLPDLNSGLMKPWKAIYDLELNPMLIVSPSPPSAQLALNLTKPKEISILNFKFTIEGVTGLLAKGGSFDFGVVVTINGRRQILRYPFAVPLPEPPVPAFKLNYLGLGQRVQVPDVASAMTVGQAMTKLKESLRPKDGAQVLEVLRKFYQPESNWLIAFDLQIRDLLTLQVIFNDPLLYGLRIGIQRKPLDGLSFEILYKKISDEVGLFYLDFTLPIAFRQIELGQVSITLPSVAISIYTNGDFLVSIGWPLGERSITVQVFPFLGGGGFYFGKLSSATSPDVPPQPKYAPILVFGIALRLGVGKEINKGLLTANFSVSLYGIFEGRLAWIERPAAAPRALTAGGDGESPQAFAGESSAIPDYYWFRGTFGIIGILQGAVDFAIIKATLTVRIEAKATVTFETGKPIPITIEASVSVTLKIEIGGFSLFGVRISITISFSFNADISVTFVINAGSARGFLAAQEAARPPLRWEALPQAFVPTEAVTIPLYFVPQITVVEHIPQFIAALSIPTEPAAGKNDSPFKLFVDAVAKWVVSLAEDDGSINVAPEGTPLRRHRLEALGERLRVLQNAHRVGESSPSDIYRKMVEFLTQSFNFEVSAVPPSKTGGEGDAGGTIKGAVFPVFAELNLNVVWTPTPPAPPVNKLSVSFDIHNPKPDEYHDRLNEYFQELLVAFAQPGQSFARARAAEEEGTSMAKLIFIDYFNLIVRETHQALLARVTPEEFDTFEHAAPVRLRDALAVFDYDSIAAKASRFMQYGLRLPETIPADRKSWPQLPLSPLYAMTGQQFAIELPAQGAADYTVKLDFDEGVKWLKKGATPPAFTIGKDDAAGRAAFDKLAQLNLGDGFKSLDTAPWLARRQKNYTLKNITDWTTIQGTPGGSGSSRVLAIPGPLAAEVASDGSLNVLLFDDPNTDDPQKALSFQTALRVDLTLRRVARASEGNVSEEGRPIDYEPNIYQLGGADETTRKLLSLLLRSEGLNISSISLLYPPTGGGAGLNSADLSDRVILVQTNLSTTSNPVAERLLRASVAKTDEPPVFAKLNPDGWIDFLTLIWECSIVNSGGFYLFYQTADGKDLPAELFQPSGSTPFTVLVTFKGEDALLRPFHNALVISDAEAGDNHGDAGSTFYALAVDKYNYDAAVPPGCVGFRMVRQNPKYGHAAPASLAVRPHGATDLTHPQVLDTLRANGIGPEHPDRDALLAESGDDLQAQVQYLFNLVQFQLVKTDAFSESVWSFPVGPAESASGRKAARALRARSAAPDGGETPDWTYEQTLGVYRYAIRNEDSAAVNRYTGVGGKLTLQFRVLDIFGNLPGGQLPRTLGVEQMLYHDRLLVIRSWPGVATSYTVTKVGSQVTLSVEISFDPNAVIPPSVSDGVPPSDKARQALIAYDLIYDQITDPNTEASLETTLTPETVFQIATVAGSPLAGFVDGVRVYLRSIIGGGAPTPPGPLPLDFTLNGVMRAAQKKDIFKVEVVIWLRRTKYVDPDNPAAGAAVMEVKPKISEYKPGVEADGTYTLIGFAREFEGAFAGGLKVAVGRGLAQTDTRRLRRAAVTGTRAEASAQDSNDTSDSTNIWAVRLNPVDGIRFTVSDQRYYYAPAPLSTSLQSGSFHVRRYRDDWDGGNDDFECVLRSFTDIDLDLWLAAFLRAFDAFIAPRFATAAAEVDPAGYRLLMDYKEQIAGAISQKVTHVLQDEVPPSKAQLEQAKQVFYQRLLIRLSSAYEVNTIVQMPLAIVVPNYDPHEQFISKLYGDVSVTPTTQVTLPEGTPEQSDAGFSISKLTLVPDTQNLTFLFTSAQPTLSSHFAARLGYNISFVETDIPKTETHVLERGQYVNSSWLKFVLPKDEAGQPEPSLNPVLGDVDIPIPLRQFPASPKLQQQSATQTFPDPATPDQLLKWDYGVTYEHAHIGQDAIWLLANYNTPAASHAPRLRAAADDKNECLRPPATLFEALARFMNEYTAVAAHFAAIPDAAWRDKNRPEALAAISRFTALAQGVAITLNPRAMSQFALALSPVVDKYWLKDDLNLSSQKIIYVRRYAHTTPEDLWPTWPVIAGYERSTDGGPTESLDEEAGEQYQEAVYIEKPTDDSDDPNAPVRDLKFRAHNIMVRQNASTSMWLKRNEVLVKGRDTNQAFVYRTPDISFTNFVTPLIGAERTIPLDPFPGDTLRAKLKSFFEHLTNSPQADPHTPSAPARENTGEVSLLLKLAAGYSYALAEDAGEGEDGEEEGLRVSIPLLLAQDYDLSNIAGLVQDLGDRLYEWYAGALPATTRARLEFSLTIFALQGGTKLPLINVRQLVLTVNPDPSWWKNTGAVGHITRPRRR